MSQIIDQDRIEPITVVNDVSKKYDLEQTLREMDAIHFSGHIIPHRWFKSIQFDDGKTDVVSIIILSDIVYHYRPVVFKDDHGNTLMSSRFEQDKLDRTIQYFTNNFGFTVRQTRDALGRLEGRGLIEREYRYAQDREGRIVKKLFISPVVKNIADISQLKSDTKFSKKSFPYNVQTLDGKSPCDDQTLHGKNVENTGPLPSDVKTLYGEIPCDDQTSQVVRLNVDIYKNKIYKENKEAVAEEKQPLQVQQIAAAANNSKNKLMRSTAIRQNTIEPKINDVLTENQKVHLSYKLATLALDETITKRLVEQIEAGLIDPKHLAKCGNDYHHKLNAIFKMISAGTWTPPASFIPAEEVEKAKILSEEREALNAMMQQYNKHYCDYNHWKKMCDWLSEKSTAAEITAFNNFSALWRTSWENLCTVHKTIRQTFPDAAIAAIPDAPETHKSTNNPLQTVGVIQ